MIKLNNGMENSFKITQFSSTKDKDWIEAIKIYNATTPSEIKTDTNELSYWLNNQIHEKGFEPLFFCLYIQNQVVGFAMLTHLKVSKVLLYEYIAFKEGYRTNTIFFAFVDIIESYIKEKNYDISSYVVEISNKLSGQAIDKESKFFKQLICLQGFSKIECAYRTLQVGVDNFESSFDAFLYIKRNDISIVLEPQTYLQIIKDIYINYTFNWYKPFLEDDSVYAAHAFRTYEQIENEVSNYEKINIQKPSCNLLSNDDASAYIRNTPRVTKNKYITAGKALLVFVAGLVLFLIVGIVIEKIGFKPTTNTAIIQYLSALFPLYAIMYSKQNT